MMLSCYRQLCSCGDEPTGGGAFNVQPFRVKSHEREHALREVFSSEPSSSTRRSMGRPLSLTRVVPISMSAVWLFFSSVPTVLMRWEHDQAAEA